MRTVTVWCADWPLLAAGVPPDQPAAVFHGNRVTARSRAAGSAGVRIGQRRRVAQRACPHLVIVDHDPARDARRFEPVVRAVAEMAPRLEVVEPGWISLAARGPSRYFGGDELLADRLVELVTDTLGDRVSFQVGVGVADGRAASAIAARLASRRPAGTMIIEHGGTPAFVAPLPIGWLQRLGEVDAELIDLFTRLGLARCGDLGALTRSEVMSRFGYEGLHAHRLACGDDDRAPMVTQPPVDRAVAHRFDEPVERLEPVVFVGKRLADRLVEQLADDGQVCTRLLISADTDRGERHERMWYRDDGFTAAAIVERIRWQLEGWVALGGLSGGLIELGVMPDQVRADDGRQDSFWGARSRADDDAARAIARLSGIAGEHAVRVPEWVGGRLPAERYRWVPAAEVDLDDPDGRLDTGGEPWPGATKGPSPIIVYHQPQPIEILDERGCRVGVSGRGVISGRPVSVCHHGVTDRVVAWAGPWPLEQRWWDPERSRRLARLQIVLSGGEAHLVAIEGGVWGVLATYG